MALSHTTTHHRNPIEFFQDLFLWMSENWIELTIGISIGTLIYLTLTLLSKFVARLCEKAGTNAPVMSVIGRAARRTSHIFLMLVAARLVLGYIDPPAGIFTTIRFLFTISAVIQGALWARAVILGIIDLKADPGNGGYEALANASGLLRVLVTVALFSIALVVVLDNLGVNVTGLVAGLGIGGIAIGLAAQGIFSDLFASLSIIFDRPFRVGDAINFGSETAVVERIGLKSTRLRAITGEKKIVGNAQLLGKEITSFAELDRRRLKFAIGVTYQTTPDAAERIPELMRSIIEAAGGVFVRCGFINFGASSLDFEVEYDVMSGAWDEVYAMRHKIGLGILRRFSEEGLEFAYPTQTTFTAAPDGRMIMPYPEGGAWPQPQER